MENHRILVRRKSNRLIKPGLQLECCYVWSMMPTLVIFIFPFKYPNLMNKTFKIYLRKNQNYRQQLSGRNKFALILALNSNA